MNGKIYGKYWRVESQLGPSELVWIVVNPRDYVTRKIFTVQVEKSGGIYVFLGPSDPMWISVKPSSIDQGDVVQPR